MHNYFRPNLKVRSRISVNVCVWAFTTRRLTWDYGTLKDFERGWGLWVTMARVLGSKSKGSELIFKWCGHPLWELAPRRIPSSYCSNKPQTQSVQQIGRQKNNAASFISHSAHVSIMWASIIIIQQIRWWIHLEIILNLTRNVGSLRWVILAGQLLRQQRLHLVILAGQVLRQHVWSAMIWAKD